MKLKFAAVAFATLALAPWSLWAQPPSVTHAVPSGVSVAQPTDVTFVGAGLAGSTGAWTNAPGTLELAPGIEGNNTRPDSVIYRFTPAANATVGVYGVRFVGPAGVSGLRLLMVDDLATVLDNSANKTIETAQPVAFPAAVDGACEAESYDYYKISVAAGQRISVEVVGRRLGSPVDPVVRLIDASGREFAFSDDEPGIGYDCRFMHTFAAAGDYLLEVSDRGNKGSPSHRYRLRIGDFPLVTAPFPTGGPAGGTVRVAVAGAQVEGVSPMTVALPQGASASLVSLAAKFNTGAGSAPLTLLTSTLPEQIEMEPNDAPESATRAAIPGVFNGRFEVPKDRDWFEFSAKAGQRFRFIGITRALGSPTDLFMRLRKADGTVLAEAEDSGADEGIIDFAFTEDGVFRLSVEDNLSRRGGPEHVYRVEVEPYRPGFTLALDADKFDVPKGGYFLAKVTTVRRDYTGPITLSVVGAGDGFQLSNNVIPENAAEVVMTVKAPDGLEQGKPHLARIVGTAKIGDADFAAVASTLTPLRAQLGGLMNPPSDLIGSIGLGVGPVFPEFFQLAVDEGVANFAQVQGAAVFTVKATKTNGFDEAITLVVEGLPPGVTAAVTPIEKGKAEAAVTLTGPAALADGEFPFKVVGTSAFQNQPGRFALDKLVMRVVKPIEVSLTPAGSMAPGGTLKVKVALRRHGGANGAVTVSFKNPSLGVNTPAEVTIAEGQSEAEVEFTAAADAVPGQRQVSAVGAIKINERLVVVDSKPATLEIAAAQAAASQ